MSSKAPVAPERRESLEPRSQRRAHQRVAQVDCERREDDRRDRDRLRPEFDGDDLGGTGEHGRAHQRRLRDAQPGPAGEHPERDPVAADADRDRETGEKAGADPSRSNVTASLSSSAVIRVSSVCSSDGRPADSPGPGTGLESGALPSISVTVVSRRTRRKAFSKSPADAVILASASHE